MVQLNGSRLLAERWQISHCILKGDWSKGDGDLEEHQREP